MSVIKKYVRTYVLILIALVFTTCKKDHLLDCMTSTGKVITEHRKPGSFTKLNVKDNVDVIYHYDTICKLTVTAGQNLIDGIITELEGNTVYIRNENKCNWVRSFKNTYTIDVYAPEIENVQMFGSGDFTTADTLRTADFFLESWNASGSAMVFLYCDQSHLINNIGRMDITAKGKTRVSFIYINDTGVLNAQELKSDYCYIRSSTTGKCSVAANIALGVEIRSVGNVYYFGNPQQIDQDITGSGNLISR